MIEVKNLTKQYGKFFAVKNISFTVNEGEVFALLGPNGSGKTTTIKSIVGLNIPTSGKILINGVDISSDSTEAKKYLSYLPQRVVFPENLTAREIIRFYGKMRNISKDVADRALEEATFNGFSDKHISKFSGGMIQKLGLAVVAMANTPILILDEPSVSLDPHGVIRLREFIKEKKSEGKTILFSSHMLSEVEQLADRVAILVNGKLIMLESIENIKKSFETNKTFEELYLSLVEEI